MILRYHPLIVIYCLSTYSFKSSPAKVFLSCNNFRFSRIIELLAILEPTKLPRERFLSFKAFKSRVGSRSYVLLLNELPRI